MTEESPAGRGKLFEELVLPHLDDLYRVACRLERDTDRGEDLLQQALLTGFRKFDQLRSTASFRAWMVRILRRTYLNRRRGHIEETKLEDDDPAPGPLSPDPGAFDPELRFFARRLADDLKTALDRLPEEQRLAVLLVDVEGFKYAEAAEALEVSPGTVASRVARGRRALQKTLARWARTRDRIEP